VSGRDARRPTLTGVLAGDAIETFGAGWGSNILWFVRGRAAGLPSFAGSPAAHGVPVGPPNRAGGGGVRSNTANPHPIAHVQNP